MLIPVVKFTVEGVPVGKGRPKFARRGNFVQAYTPTKTKAYEQQVADAARVAMGSKLRTMEPVQVNLDMYLPIPASWSKLKRQLAQKGVVYPTVKPDIDNVAKAVFDAMNGIVFQDDKQIVNQLVTKHYSDNPRVEARIYEVSYDEK